MNMNRPIQNEKDISINTILQKGLQKPMSMWTCLNELYRTLGLRFIFWDTANVLVLSVIALVLVFVGQIFSSPEYKHATLFGYSPLMFVIIISFTETLEHMDGLYELKMTCKYTIKQVTAFRILCFSVIGILFSTVITVYQSESLSDLFRLLPLSFSAFFLCSFICLFFIHHFIGKCVYVMSAIIWIMVATIPAFILGERWEHFLSELPALITIGIAIFSGVLSLYEIKKFVLTNKREAAYVIG